MVFRSLTEGILIGFALSTLLFLHRMAQSVEVEQEKPILAEKGVPDKWNGNRGKPYDAALATDPDIIVYRISGAFFSAPPPPWRPHSTASASIPKLM